MTSSGASAPVARNSELGSELPAAKIGPGVTLAPLRTARHHRNILLRRVVAADIKDVRVGLDHVGYIFERRRHAWSTVRTFAGSGRLRLVARGILHPFRNRARSDFALQFVALERDGGRECGRGVRPGVWVFDQPDAGDDPAELRLPEDRVQNVARSQVSVWGKSFFNLRLGALNEAKSPATKMRTMGRMGGSLFKPDEAY